MPYNPGQTYHGDLYLNQGIASAGNAIAEGADEALKTKRQDDFNRTALDHYYEQGMIKPDEYAKALQGNASARSGLITSTQADLHHYYTQEAQGAELKNRTDIANLENQTLKDWHAAQ